jgi:copper ion binding protein
MIKKLFTVALLASALIACNNSPKQDTTSTKGSKVQANKTVTLAVEGMTCDGCENTVKESVEKLPGVESATASYKEKTAVVSFDSTQSSTTEISKAITDAGYEVKGVKPATNNNSKSN